MFDTAKSTQIPFEDFSQASTVGATFHRVDLHVHSFGVSPDVKDEEMTVPRIVEQAIARGIGLLSITDHNAIDSTDELIVEGARQGLAVIAGVELSMADGHVLVFFDPARLDAYKKWFGKLDFKENAARTERWLHQPIHELAEDVATVGGITIPAHAGRKGSGCLVKATSKAQDAIIASPDIYAIEVDGRSEFDWFSSSDKTSDSGHRKEQLSQRVTALGDVAGSRLSKLYFSDAHRLDLVGRNRDGQERLTRVKMTTPSFAAFRLALHDPEARIRLEDQLPESYPRIVGVRFVGGFLDGQEIALSQNLTCLIGGRGAGKSTALEALRCVCLNTEHERELQGDAEWPDMVQLIYEDAFGQREYVQRAAGEATVALANGDAVEYTIPIDGYAQDRVADIIRQYGNDRSQLGDFLDDFANLKPYQERVAATRSLLEGNAEAIRPIGDAAARRTTAEKALAEIQLKLEAIEKSNLKEALTYKRNLTRERQLRTEILKKLTAIEDDIGDQDLQIGVAQLAVDSEVADLATTPGKKYLVGDGAGNKGLVGLIADLESKLSAWKKSGQAKLAQARPDIDTTISAWQAYDQRVETRFQKIITDLRARGINPDVKELTRLTDAETKAKDTVRLAKDDEIALAKLRRERKKLLDDYSAAQEARFYERQQSTKSLTEALNHAIREFKVKLSFERGGSYVAYERWLRDAMNNRFFRSERVGNFCRLVRPIDLAELVTKKSKSGLLALKDDKGTAFFGSEVDDFIRQIGEADLMGLEAIDVGDAPVITLTTKIDGKIRTVPFGRLSFGQKASILLGALLCSDDTRPLMIDQPEDHLDSAFIFETVVATLRKVKEQRQVILATHNANIAVLGDAELIVPLQGYGNAGRIRDSGAVDAEATRKRACKILEGGASAYERRGEMYGLLER
jgi:energy-coupling factor transporter ATP-binding protein EcfA2